MSPINIQNQAQKAGVCLSYGCCVGLVEGDSGIHNYSKHPYYNKYTEQSVFSPSWNSSS